MKNRIAIIFLLLPILITGCRSTPLVSSETKSNSEISEHKDIISKLLEKVDEKQNKAGTQITDEDVKIVIIKTEYDTDKPVQSGTGKHPVKSETKTEITKNKHDEKIATESSMKSVESTADYADKSKVQTKSSQLDKAKQESPKDPYRFRYIFYTVIVLVAVLIFVNRTRIVSFFKKLFDTG